MNHDQQEALRQARERWATNPKGDRASLIAKVVLAIFGVGLLLALGLGLLW